MARTRQIKPGFFLHTDLAELEPICRLLFIGLWTVADREGRLKLNPKRITAELLPYESGGTTELLRCLRRLALSGFLMIYKDDTADYIEIVNFKKHQHVHRDEKPSELPSISDCQLIEDQEFIEKYRISTEEAPYNFGSSTEEAPKLHALKLISSNSNPLTLILPTELPKESVQKIANSELELSATPTPEMQIEDKQVVHDKVDQLLGRNGEREVLTRGEYVKAIKVYLCGVLPGSTMNEVGGIAGKFIDEANRYAFGKHPDKVESWPPREAYIEFFKQIIEEDISPTNGKPKTVGSAIAYMRNKINTDPGKLQEYASESYKRAGL